MPHNLGDRRYLHEITLRTIVALFLSVGISGCGAPPSTQDAASASEPELVRALGGIPVVGGPHEARAAGLTTCKVDAFVFCRSGPIEFFGTKATAARVMMSWPGNTEEKDRTPETAAFDSIDLDYPPIELRAGCELDQSNSDALSCATNSRSALVELQRRLLKDGWVAKTDDCTRHYYKQRVLARIEVAEPCSRSTTSVTVRSWPTDLVDNAITKIRDERQSRKEQTSRNAAFERAMKQ